MSAHTAATVRWPAGAAAGFESPEREQAAHSSTASAAAESFNARRVCIMGPQRTLQQRRVRDRGRRTFLLDSRRGVQVMRLALAGADQVNHPPAACDEHIRD